MKVIGGLALVCVVLLDLAGVASNETNCAKITFIHLQGNYMKVEEHSTASIDFKVRNDSCSHLQLEQIIVKRDTKEYCRIRNLIEWVHPVCQCRDYVCSVNKTFSQEDSRPWTFRSPGDRIKDETLIVNVTYDTVITSFQLGGASNKTVVEVVAGQGVSAKCEWKRGHPPQDVFIRTNMGNVTTQPHGDGRTFLNPQVTKSAKCEDTGQYRCQVDGTNQSKTVTLLVKCPPQFLDFNGASRTSQVLYGADEDLNFSIFSYRNITKCTLQSHQNEQLLECKSNRSKYIVSGAPPDWNLRLTIKDVSEEDNGTWHLIVENGFQGEATVNFTLDVKLQTSSNTPTATTEPPPTSPLVSALIGVVGFLVLVIVVLVVFVDYFRKMSQRKGAVIRTRNEDNQGDGFPDRVSGHSYEEVPGAAAPRPPRCHQHGQGQTLRPGRLPTAPTRPAVDSQPDDYLYPVNSQTASSGTNQSADVPAAEPGGPYNSLEMSDVGLRSPYSQLGM